MKAAQEEEIIVTRRGRPFALLVPVSENDMDQVRKAAQSARMRAALDNLRADAKLKGADAITNEEVNEEITAYRKVKRARRCA